TCETPFGEYGQSIMSLRLVISNEVRNLVRLVLSSVRNKKDEISHFVRNDKTEVTAESKGKRISGLERASRT
ncbi:MAG: hypothetical protein QG656_449, partial [Candidatus Hydrogenedentes bacterium]|nr:hypothetical protein [Candidatus Hydrogenedentota bacterium]